MLVYLGVKGFAIIDELAVEFAEGFNVITGETGAGKSIIINALSTLMNAKVSSEVVRSSADQAVITGHFTNGNVEEHILKRIVGNTGRSRAFLNDEPVTLGRLESLGSSHISIYGQNEFQHLVDKDNYINIIDNLLRLSDKRENLAEKVDDFRKTSAELESSRKEITGRDKEMELLQFQVEEIEKKGPQENEEEELREKLKTLKSAEKISDLLREVTEGMQGSESSAQSLVKRFSIMLKHLGPMEALDDLNKKVETLSFDIEDLMLEVRDVERSLVFDPEEIEKTEERLVEIFKLKEKYGRTCEEITQYCRSARERLDRLASLSLNMEELEKRKKSIEAEMTALSKELSASRRKGAAGIEKGIVSELGHLSMKDLQFQIVITDKGSIDRDGEDEIELMISTNPGEPLKPLRKVASGGELSRIMLAIKKVIGGDEEKTLIFDEVDAGIGGRVADLVGKRLHELSRTHQVICITHLPQIAAYGDRHFFVSKAFVDGKTKTTIRALSEDERAHEIARMMGGETITEKTLERAKEMLRNDQKSAN